MCPGSAFAGTTLTLEICPALTNSGTIAKTLEIFSNEALLTVKATLWTTKGL